jgi:hypothetical protein
MFHQNLRFADTNDTKTSHTFGVKKTYVIHHKASICVCSVFTNCSTEELYTVDNFPWNKIVQQCSTVGKEQ